MSTVYFKTVDGCHHYKVVREDGTLSELVPVSAEVEKIIFAAYMQGLKEGLPREDSAENEADDEESAENEVDDEESSNQAVYSRKACDYDFPIAALSDEVKRMKYEQKKLLKREERVELIRLKGNFDAVKGQRDSLDRKIKDIRKWMSRPRTMPHGVAINYWDEFVRDYPEYDCPYDSPLFFDYFP